MRLLFINEKKCGDSINKNKYSFNCSFSEE